jgi:hypothetical protein
MSFITYALHPLEATATLFTESVAHIHLASARKPFAPPCTPADMTAARKIQKERTINLKFLVSP